MEGISPKQYSPTTAQPTKASIHSRFHNTDRQTTPPAHLLGHLGSGAEIMTNTVQLTLDGKPAADGDFNQNVWTR